MPILLCTALPVFAQDVGVHGETYPIAEQDFLEFIQARLGEMEKNGDIARHQTELQKRAARSADRPIPVSHITHTQKTRTFLFDPSIVTSRDIQDAKGNTVIPRGTIVNPLKQVTLSKTLLFYDADVPEHVAWVKKTDHALSGKTTLVLVKGSISEQSNQFERPVYFDQQGKITKKLGIQYVPARVDQKGEKLQIQEVKL